MDLSCSRPGDQDLLRPRRLTQLRRNTDLNSVWRPHPPSLTVPSPTRAEGCEIYSYEPDPDMHVAAVDLPDAPGYSTFYRRITPPGTEEGQPKGRVSPAGQARDVM
jgi:hypothetical protein